MEKIHTFSEVQKELGFRHPHTMADLVRRLGLKVKPVPHSGPGKGLDDDDLRLIQERLAPISAVGSR